MLKRHITSKTTQVPAKAAAPKQGAAAFFCSTGKRPLPVKTWKSTISQQKAKPAESINFYNLLMEKDYFRRKCAKHPIPNVVLTEGQTKPPQMAREVTAWII